jgi:hypothetical protein
MTPGLCSCGTKIPHGFSQCEDCYGQHATQGRRLSPLTIIAWVTGWLVLCVLLVIYVWSAK